MWVIYLSEIRQVSGRKTNHLTVLFFWRTFCSRKSYWIYYKTRHPFILYTVKHESKLKSCFYLFVLILQEERAIKLSDLQTDFTSNSAGKQLKAQVVCLSFS